MPKKLDPCMFCGEVPCVCPGSKANKKSTGTRKRSASTPQTNSTTSQAPGPSLSASSIKDNSSPVVDLKAAMKAASNDVQRPQPDASAYRSTSGQRFSSGASVTVAESLGSELQGSKRSDEQDREVVSEDRSEQLESPEDGPELARAVSILEPLLSPEDSDDWQPFLNYYFSPLQRWRLRNGK